MKVRRKFWLSLLAGSVAVVAASSQAPAQHQKPNILFIMGDDIGWMQPSIYHRGLMVGETPNIDRIGNEGAIFMDYVAMQSCTSGRNAFFTGMYPLRTGMIPPQLPGSPSYLRPGTPATHHLDIAPCLTLLHAGFVDTPVLATGFAHHRLILWRQYCGDMHTGGVVPDEKRLVRFLGIIAIKKIDDLGRNFLIHCL